MLIFFGLGNNEEKYFNTKHNAGRKVLEKLIEKQELNLQKGEKFYFAKTKWQDLEVVYLYSTGYMNLSGEALYSYLNYYKIKINPNHDTLVVLQDDSDQIEDNNKLVLGGGTAGHRGIDSIYKHLNTLNYSKENIWRLKIGIRPEQNILKSETFVLSHFSNIDEVNITNLVDLIEKNKSNFTSGSWDKIQQSFNTKIIKNPPLTVLKNPL
jgi:PTH1 family peptidyl-tRNA hydrolase